MTARKTTPKGTRKPTTPRTISVVVCTEHRGVFFGEVDAAAINATTMRLVGARNCLGWSKTIGGILGLASVGPNKDCRIGATAPALTLHKLTAVLECSEAAAKAWIAAPAVS